jgi:hypothetical protein
MKQLACALVVMLVACGGDDGDDDGACAQVSLAAAAHDVALPSGYAAGSFALTAQAPACGAAGTPSYVLADIGGDRRPDLVVTRVCGDTATGDTRWMVHTGGDAGFAAATPFALPSGYGTGAFPSTSGQVPCGAPGTPAYATLDLTGDGRLDLVVTRKCGDTAVGDTRWLVHPGGDAGFAASPIAWTLPTGYAAGSFAATAQIAVCTTPNAPSYVLADATGDGQVDLIVTKVCGDNATGDTRWFVHAGGAAGFGAASPWQLPTGYAAGSFAQASQAPPCGATGTPAYTTTDLDGDDRFDLLVTRVCGDTTVGDTHWVVHRGQDGGFAAAASYALPTGYASGSFPSTAGAVPCDVPARPGYQLVDVGGDGRLDMLVTRVCSDAAIGDTRWRVHGGDAAGFSAATDVPLPTGYPAGSFPTAAGAAPCGAAGTPAYSLVDFGGDGRPDLLVTRRCGDAAIGDTRWLLHSAECGG